MPRVADQKIIKNYSKFLLFSDKGTKKYFAISNDRLTKNNQKNMNQ